MPEPQLITTAAQWLNMNNAQIQIELAGVDAPKSQEVKAIVLSEKDKKRFLTKFKRGSHADDCWLWTAGVFDSGYGSFGVFRPKKQLYRAHRVSYHIHVGEIPDGMLVLHNCPNGDTPACVNPAHLWLGTHLDNQRDKWKKGRENHPRGEDSSSAKTTEDVVLKLRAMYATGHWQQKQLAEKFGINKIMVHYIVTRKTWKHI